MGQIQLSLRVFEHCFPDSFWECNLCPATEAQLPEMRGIDSGKSLSCLPDAPRRLAELSAHWVRESMAPGHGVGIIEEVYEYEGDLAVVAGGGPFNVIGRAGIELCLRGSELGDVVTIRVRDKIIR